MDELSAAAATLVVSMDIEDEEERGVEATCDTSAAAKVLTSMGANQGVLGSLDPRSCFPSSSRGLSSSNIIPLIFALFCPGPDRRKRAGAGPR